ncbi:MAG: hypothetical protein MZV65_28485 [Chromatiales bacterium]|nr:hypothetical protein [Chromatiales bacterium]
MSGSKQYGKGFWSGVDIERNLREGAAQGVKDAAYAYFAHLPESDDAVKAGIAEGFHRWLDENKADVLSAIAKEHIHIISHEKLNEWLESLSDA